MARIQLGTSNRRISMSTFELHDPSEVFYAVESYYTNPTGFTPFHLMLGRHARVPIDIMYGTPTPPMTPVTEYAACLKQRLENAYQQVCEKMGHDLDRPKDLYDKRIHGKPLAAGARCGVYDKRIHGKPLAARARCGYTAQQFESKKLHCPCKGPFRIIWQLSDVTYRIQNVKKGDRGW